MQVFGVPVPLRHPLRTIGDWCRMALLRPRNIAAKAHFVYFSYEPDHEYLCLSLLSLSGSVKCDFIGSVTVFEDQKAPFSENQIQALCEILPDLVIRPVEDFSWASVKSTLAELKCFVSVAEKASPNDLIIKVDSDILFFQSNKIERLLSSNLQAIGDGHQEAYLFAQGGLYMIRASVVLSVFSDVTVDDLIRVSQRVNSLGEDRAVSCLLADSGTPFQFTRLMLYPTEYRRIKRLGVFARWDFCSAHFVRDKESMKKFFELFFYGT